MSVTTAQATSLLENVLFESASQAAANAAGWVALSNLNTTYSTVAGLATAMASSAEASIADQVVRYYEGALGRNPSGTEISYYVAIAEQGLTASQIAQGASAVSQAQWNVIAADFANSPEFAFASASASSVVTLLYLNILGRAPTSTEVAYYNAQLSSGLGTSILVQEFTNSPEYQTKIGSSITTALASYGASVANGTTPATITVTTPVTTTSVALTTGVDTLTPTGNTSVSGTANASGATFTAGDSIVASGNNNTLNLSDTATRSATNWTPTSLSGVTVSGVQAVVLSTSEGITADFTSSQGWTGLTSVTVTSAGDGYAESVKAGASTAITWTDTLNTTNNLTVTGGSVDTVTVNNNVTGAAQTITVAGGSGTTSVSVIQTESATGFDQAVTINDTNNGSTTKAGTITSVTLNGLDAHAAQINDNSLANLTIDNVAAATTVTVNQNATFATANSSATTLNATLDGDTNLALVDGNNTYTTLKINVGSTNAASSSIVSGSHFTSATTLAVSGTGELIYTGTAGNFATDFAAVTTLTVSGTAGLSADVSSLAATLTAITATNNATTSGTNINNLTLGAGQAYTHTGTATDIITIAAAPTAALAAGTGTGDELIYNAAGAGAQTTLAGSGGSITGFEILGTGASSTGTYDLTTNTGFTGIDVNGAVAGALTFTRVAAKTTLEIDGAAGQNITYSSADSSGATDALSLTLGIAKTDARVTDGIATATGAAFTATSGTLTVQDSASTGYGTINVTVNETNASAVTIATLADSMLGTLSIGGTGALIVTNFTNDTASSLTIANTSSSTTASSIGDTAITDNSLTTLSFTGTGYTGIAGTLSDTQSTLNISQGDTNSHGVTIGTITDANLSTLNMSGAGALTITNLTSPTGALVTLNNTGTGGLTVTTFTDNSMSTLNLTGTGKETITTLTDGSTTITVLDSNSANVGIATFTATSATSETFQNSGAGTLTVGNTANTGAALATLNLLGKVAYTATADALTGAITVLGGSDHANVSLTFTGTEATGTTQSVTLGNGNNTVDWSAAGAGATADRVVVVGNGNNTITDTNAGSTSTFSATVGSGNNSVTLGSAHTTASTITFSAANGGSVTSLTTVTNATHAAADAFVFATAAINQTINYEATAVSSAAAGVSAANLSDGLNVFNDGTNTYIYEYTGSAATSELVKLAGVVITSNVTSTDASHFHL